MTPARWTAVKQIFFAALDRSPTARTRFLTAACDGDANLAEDVGRLLQQQRAMGGFLETAAVPPAIDTPALSLGALIARRFRILQLAGSGGMGEVYAAEDLELGGPVALKVALRADGLDPFALDRFRREVKMARQITHENVCRVFDIGRHRQGEDEIAFFTMEWLEGETLSQRLRRAGPLPPAEVRSLAGQLCQGLAAAHRQDIAHGDLKRGNLMLVPGQGLKILDFGLACHRQDPPVASGGFFGTLDYLAPEQIESGMASPAADIYAAGIVLHEALTGTRPTGGELSPSLPPEWQAAIRGCLAREPSRRFGSPGLLARNLPEVP